MVLGITYFVFKDNDNIFYGFKDETFYGVNVFFLILKIVFVLWFMDN